MWKKDVNSLEVAQLIERFLNRRKLYPQEWNDFVDTSQHDEKIEAYRRRCYEIDPLVNRPVEPDREAVEELKSMVDILRSQ